MTEIDEKLKRVYEIETVGEVSKKFHLRILMDIGREFTHEDKMAIQDCANKLQESIYEQTCKLSPKLKEEAEKEREEIINCFQGRIIFVEEIPNGYSNSGYSKMFPWFKVTTKYGHIKIGWRKRVIEIDWSESALAATSKELFSDEDVTKGDQYIHAWGYEKAKEYLNKLLNDEKV